ncbi:MAG TPA: hypothetical protein VGC26_08205, partial [Afipia sp.]
MAVLTASCGFGSGNISSYFPMIQSMPVISRPPWINLSANSKSGLIQSMLASGDTAGFRCVKANATHCRRL